MEKARGERRRTKRYERMIRSINIDLSPSGIETRRLYISSCRFFAFDNIYRMHRELCMLDWRVEGSRCVYYLIKFTTNLHKFRSINNHCESEKRHRLGIFFSDI